ncbi:MAG: class I SAM-dependent methyltransferase [Pseudomonadota bacterium]
MTAAVLPPLYADPADRAAVAAYEGALPCHFVSPGCWPNGAQGDVLEGFWLAFQQGRLHLYRGREQRGQSIALADIERRAVRTSELARACGFGRRSGARESAGIAVAARTVLDGTAGWGVDGVTLARLGARVHLLEQEAPIWALCHDLCAASSAAVSAFASAVLPRGGAFAQAHHATFEDWLAGGLDAVPERVDVVYLDPMFPPRRKAAAARKRLQYLDALLAGREAPSAALIAQWVVAARERARERVVVKRRRHEGPPQPAADWQILGSSVRYDVYAAR